MRQGVGRKKKSDERKEKRSMEDSGMCTKNRREAVLITSYQHALLAPTGQLKLRKSLGGKLGRCVAKGGS
jgi:hypothetical protein